MSFVFYDLTFLVLFSLVLGIILYKNRARIKREGIFILYRTKWGIKLINKIGKHKKFLHAFEIVILIFGYLLMIAGIASFAQFVWIFASDPAFIRAIKIPPIAPLIPYLPQLFKADYLPAFYFTYWIVVLAITAMVHEFFHGIFAKARDVKIKSTGFAFIGPFFGAFVEPDEKKVQKLRKKPQIAFLSAGSFSNMALGIIFFGVLVLFFFSTYSASGVIFRDYSQVIISTSGIILTNNTIFIDSGIGLNLTEINFNNEKYYIQTQGVTNLKNYPYVYAYENTPALNSGLIGAITEIDGKKINTNEEFSNMLSSKIPGETINIKTNLNNEIRDYTITLASSPRNSSKAYLGIAQVNLKEINSRASIFGKIRNSLVFFKDPNTYYQPKHFPDFTVFIYNLIWWMVLVNFGVALFNMLPLGVTDGGRVFYLTFLGLTKSEKIAKAAYKIATYLILLSLLAVTFFWIMSF